MTAVDHVKRGDNGPILTYLLNADLTGWTVTLLARRAPDVAPAWQKTGTPTVANGVTTASFTLTSVETASAGVWLVEVEAINGATRLTWPSEGYGRLVIEADLT
ncbi:MAG: hypothetical protein IPL80_19885 [Sterolibacteriaceae bacterium]|nr:hypothetical protein [Sterolibacteriaceae bacterium]